MFHLDVAKVYLNVAHVFKCFKRFRPLFQTFHLDVAKVDPDVPYVAMTKSHVASLDLSILRAGPGSGWAEKKPSYFGPKKSRP